MASPAAAGAAAAAAAAAHRPGASMRQTGPSGQARRRLTRAAAAGHADIAGLGPVAVAEASAPGDDPEAVPGVEAGRAAGDAQCAGQPIQVALPSEAALEAGSGFGRAAVAPEAGPCLGAAVNGGTGAAAEAAAQQPHRAGRRMTRAFAAHRSEAAGAAAAARSTERSAHLVACDRPVNAAAEKMERPTSAAWNDGLAADADRSVLAGANAVEDGGRAGTAGHPNAAPPPAICAAAHCAEAVAAAQPTGRGGPGRKRQSAGAARGALFSKRGCPPTLPPCMEEATEEGPAEKHLGIGDHPDATAAAPQPRLYAPSSAADAAALSSGRALPAAPMSGCGRDDGGADAPTSATEVTEAAGAPPESASAPEQTEAAAPELTGGVGRRAGAGGRRQTLAARRAAGGARADGEENCPPAAAAMRGRPGSAAAKGKSDGVKCAGVNCA